MSDLVIFHRCKTYMKYQRIQDRSSIADIEVTVSKPSWIFTVSGFRASYTKLLLSLDRANLMSAQKY